MKIFKIDQVQVRGSPEDGIGPRSGNKIGQNTFKNTPEDNLDTFRDIISLITSKYLQDFLETRPDQSEL
jgi:hypothetical protein